jgi:RNA polymerase sigma-70 factor (ECF subfamily)
MVSDQFEYGRCLEEVAQGSQEDSRALVEQLYPLVIRIARANRPLRMAEEDLAQEVFIKLFARLDQYQARAGIPFEHWVARLAVRTCLDALRAERRRPEWRWSDLSEEQAAWLEYMLADDTAAPETDPGSARELVDRLMAQLPPDDRLVIRLLDLEQKSVKEIGQLTGWSTALVKVRAFRARRKLRKLAESLRVQL